VLSGYTLPPANRHRAAGERTTALSRVWTARGDRASQPAAQQATVPPLARRGPDLKPDTVQLF
jgi:hypothetical protein